MIRVKGWYRSAASYVTHSTLLRVAGLLVLSGTGICCTLPVLCVLYMRVAVCGLYTKVVLITEGLGAAVFSSYDRVDKSTSATVGATKSATAAAGYGT